MTLRTSTIVTIAGVLATGAWLAPGPHAGAATDQAMAMDHGMGTPALSVRGKLPTEAMAGRLLDTFGRHREWAEVPAGAAVIRAFLVYPDRANKAPVVIVTSRDQGMTDWVRAVTDQVAADGFIAVAPDLRGNDVSRQAAAVREYIGSSVPLVNGRFASLNLSPNADGTTRVDVTVDSAKAATFTVTPQTWSTAVEYLNRVTDNRPEGVPSEADVRAMGMGTGMGGM